MTDKNMFKRVLFGGWKPADVMNYIDELNNRNLKNINELNDSLKALKDSEKKAEFLADQLSQMTAKVAELENIIAFIDESAQNQIKEKEKENFALINQIEALKTEITELKAQQTDSPEKAQDHHELEIEIGDVLINAKMLADDIIEKANKEANNIIAAAELGKIISIDSSRNKAYFNLEEERREDLSLDQNEKLKAAVSDMKNMINNSIQQIMEEIKSNLTEELPEYQETVKSLQKTYHTNAR